MENLQTPFRLRPVYQNYLWGGTRLQAAYHKNSGTALLAESWELSALPNASSQVASGPFEGALLSDLWREQRPLFGLRCASLTDFPLLIKLLDSDQRLSVQVHPDDAFAKIHEGSIGKTEMWVILEAAPGAGAYLGFNRPVEKEEIVRRVADGTLLEVLRYIQVTPGDVLFVQPGTIHAIGEGLTVAEIQQSSDITYRLYDYGRLGADGQPRALHLEKALQVLNPRPVGLVAPGAALPEKVPGGILIRLTSNPCFTVHRLELAGMYRRRLDAQSFVSVLVTAGEATLAAGGETLTARKGDSLLVPAAAYGFTLGGQAEVLLSEV